MSDVTDPATSLVELPLLPLRDVVVFPHMVIPLFVGRPKSIKALETAMEAGKNIVLVAQKSAAKDEPSPEDLYGIGTLANILQMLKLPDGTVKVLVEGSQRAHIDQVIDLKTHFAVEATPVAADNEITHEVEAMRRTLVSQFDQYVKLNKKIPPEILTSLSGIDEPGRLADTIAAHLPLKLEQKQEVLEMFEAKKRLEHLADADRRRARYPAGRKTHPRPSQASDGEEPARVLPERAGQGDSEGARRARGRRRSGRDGKAHQVGAYAEGSAQEGRGRIQEAAA
jgi:ATP-dependent Lon protease